MARRVALRQLLFFFRGSSRINYSSEPPGAVALVGCTKGGVCVCAGGSGRALAAALAAICAWKSAIGVSLCACRLLRGEGTISLSISGM